MHKLTTLLLAAGMMFGCAKQVHKTWESSGGSRADAVVEVGFTYNPQTEQPETSDRQALEEAIKRCRAWGYESAEPFGMFKQNCQQMVSVPFGGLQCQSMLVTRQYQCLGTSPTSGGYSGTKNNYSSDPSFVGPMRPGRNPKN